MSELAGAAGSGVGGLMSLIGQLIIGGKANKIAQQNLEWQKEAFERSFQEEKATQEYQRNLQQQIFEREDSAVQRRVKDLEQAGLSSTLAAGSAAGSGPVVQVKSPEKRPAQMEVGPTLAKMQAMAVVAGVSKTMAETALIQAQAKKTSVDARVSALTEDFQIVNVENDYLKKKAETHMAMLEDNYKSALEDYLIEQSGLGRKEFLDKYSPDVIKYNMMVLDNRMKEIDADWLTRQNQLGAGSTMTRTVMDFLRLLTTAKFGGE